MLSDSIAGPSETAARGGAAAPILDILIVIAVSAAAYLAEIRARDLGVFPLGEDARGVTAVLAGAATALILVFVRGGSLRDLGFRRPRSWKTVPLWVVGILTVYVVVQNAIPALLSLVIELPAPDLSRHNPVAGDLGAAVVMALVLPFTASIPEEIIYRGFLMDRLTTIFGAGTGGAIATVAVQSLVFGSIHFGWGVGGMIVTAMMGAVWGTAFLLCGRNLWIVIIAHTVAHLALVALLFASPPA